MAPLLFSALSWQKFWELAKQVSEFMTWKQVECPFERDLKVLQYLLTVPVFSDDGKELWTSAALLDLAAA